MKTRLMNDMKEAMKAKDKLKVDTIRMVNAAIKNAEINAKKELSESEVIDVIAREIKMRRDALEEYKKANRPDEMAKIKEEIDILMAYMPKQLSESEIRQIVQETINQTSAQGAKDMGKVMGILMPKVKGKADGKLVSNIVKELLG
ncbi:GatB/YqeY domain-containing protein [Desulfotomaculum nigrificans CO-1-SRB]|uniref:GatB/YqeY domain-containing protein n=1 Tax=Desulfotomaculum nigrificans (strain DSM 14880 / VKM B-2319 / CO-1-SRB) TaxID=868595 RepID=F6B5A5_DESCC|nr:GatB/YqeY domain-containing protein [Desulfotomaculum nigrificans CO-1-SRB]